MQWSPKLLIVLPMVRTHRTSAMVTGLDRGGTKGHTVGFSLREAMLCHRAPELNLLVP